MENVELDSQLEQKADKSLEARSIYTSICYSDDIV